MPFPGRNLILITCDVLNIFLKQIWLSIPSNLLRSHSKVGGKMNSFAVYFRSLSFARLQFIFSFFWFYLIFKWKRHLEKSVGPWGPDHLFLYQRLHNKLDVNKNLGRLKYFDYRSFSAAYHYNHAILSGSRILMFSLFHYKIRNPLQLQHLPPPSQASQDCCLVLFKNAGVP